LNEYRSGLKHAISEFTDDLTEKVTELLHNDTHSKSIWLLISTNKTKVMSQCGVRGEARDYY